MKSIIVFDEIEFSEWKDPRRPGYTIVRGELLAEICVPDEAGEKALALAKKEIQAKLGHGRLFADRAI